MSNPGPLNRRSREELADMARRRGLPGWKLMKKEDLVKALSAKTVKGSAKPTAKATPAARPQKPAAKVTTKPLAKPAPVATKPAPAARPAPLNGSAPKPAVTAKPTAPVAAKPSTVPAKPPTAPKSAAKLTAKPTTPVAPGANKDLSGGTRMTPSAGASKDRIILMVPDPFWLHASWELTAQSVQRAEAALRQDWHGAKPIIRLFDVTSQDTTSTSETPVRDIVVHGGCNNWYIDIPQPPRTYRADIGYLSKRGEFFILARSNVVTPPKAGTAEALDDAWAEYDGPKKGERLLAMSSGFETADGDPELKKYIEEKLRRPMGVPKDGGFGSGGKKSFGFDLDAKLVVFGKSDPLAHVTLQNEPVKLSADGSFVMWFGLPDSRQIIPAVATSADGAEERTIVLAVERNTKHLDPMIHDPMAEG